MWGVLWKKTVTLHGGKGQHTNWSSPTNQQTGHRWLIPKTLSGSVQCSRVCVEVHFQIQTKQRNSVSCVLRSEFTQMKEVWCSLSLSPSIFHSPSLRRRSCDNGAVQMLWEGRREGAVSVQSPRLGSASGSLTCAARRVCFPPKHACWLTCDGDESRLCLTWDYLSCCCWASPVCSRPDISWKASKKS